MLLPRCMPPRAGSEQPRSTEPPISVDERALAGSHGRASSTTGSVRDLASSSRTSASTPASTRTAPPRRAEPLANLAADDRQRELARLALWPHHAGRRSTRRPRRTARPPAAAWVHLAQHLAVRVDEAGVAAAGDAEVGVARLARARSRRSPSRPPRTPRRSRPGAARPRSARSSTSTFVRPHDGQAIMIGPLCRRPSDPQDLPRDLDLLDRVGGERDPHRVADAVEPAASRSRSRS